MTIGFFVGRFQPLHNGHIRVLEWVLARAERLVVGVGSCRQANTVSNPFSFEERREMIESALSDYAGRFGVYGIPDVNDDVAWVNYIRENLPSFDIVYANAGRETSLFSGHRFKVEEVPFFKRKTYSATEVRKRILAGGDWRGLVPEATVRVIERVGGVERMKKLG